MSSRKSVRLSDLKIGDTFYMTHIPLERVDNQPICVSKGLVDEAPKDGFGVIPGKNSEYHYNYWCTFDGGKGIKVDEYSLFNRYVFVDCP